MSGLRLNLSLSVFFLNFKKCSSWGPKKWVQKNLDIRYAREYKAGQFGKTFTYPLRGKTNSPNFQGLGGLKRVAFSERLSCGNIRGVWNQITCGISGLPQEKHWACNLGWGGLAPGSVTHEKSEVASVPYTSGGFHAGRLLHLSLREA